MEVAIVLFILSAICALSWNAITKTKIYLTDKRIVAINTCLGVFALCLLIVSFVMLVACGDGGAYQHG